MNASKSLRSMHTASLLENLQQDLEVLFSSTNESILLIEANGTVLAANDVGAKWLNQTVDSLTGENLFQYLTPFGIPIREWVHGAIKNKSIQEFDAKFRKRFIHVRLIPIVINKTIRRIIIIGQDTTEQIIAEEQVREFTDHMERKVRERTAQLETLNQQLTADRQQAELLANFSKSLVRNTQDYGHLLKHITTEISVLLEGTCLIALFTSDLTFIEVAALSNHDIENSQEDHEGLLNQIFSVETSPLVSQILNGNRYSARNVTKGQEDEILPPELLAQLSKNGIDSLEAFPLHAGELVLGMLLITREHKEPYSKDEITLVDSLTGTVALAIQNARLFEQLTENQNQLRGLSQKLVHAQEIQFRELTGELHDRIGQDMTAINVNLNILQALLPEDISEDILARIEDTEQLVEESVKRMRSLMSELRPPMLDQYGLSSALSWYCEKYQRRTGTKVYINTQYMKSDRLPPEIEIALFRITQEALNNISKHAKATRVDIELFEDPHKIMISITDNGVGFDTKALKQRETEHWGLTLMEERAQSINGKFILRSVPKKGTQIIVQVKVGEDT